MLKILPKYTPCILGILLSLFSALSLFSQSLSTGNVAGSPFCTGSPVYVYFTANGTFNAGNIFTAQLSDSAGSFGAPVTLGTLASSTSGTGAVDGIISNNTIPGTHYRIRVISSNPALTATDNGVNLTVNGCYGVPFQKSYASGNAVATIGNKAIQLADNSFVIASSDIYLYKTDPRGDLIWSRLYYDARTYIGFSNQSYANAILQTYDGGFIVGGNTWYTTTSPQVTNNWIYLVKTDSLGYHEWSNTYGDDNDGGYDGTVGSFLISMKQTPDSGFIIIGCTDGFGIGVPWGMYLVKADKMGNYQWSETFNLNTYNRFTDGDILLTNDGGYVIVGEGAIIRTDGNGNVLWAKKINAGGINVAIKQTTGGYYIGSENNFTLVKTDTSGNVLWSKSYGGGYEISATVTKDGGCVLTGYGASSSNIELVKVDSTGTLQWANTYGGSQGDAVMQTPDGAYAISGSTAVYANSYLGYLIETDSAGNSCNQQTLAVTLVNLTLSATNFTPVVTVQNTQSLLPCTHSYNGNTVIEGCGPEGLSNVNETGYTASSCDTLSVTAIVTNLICGGADNGTATAIPAGGTGHYSYHWSNGERTQIATGLSMGAYLLTATDYKGDSTIISVTITQPAPVALIASPDTTICTGQTVMLSVSGATGYSWQPGTGLSDSTGSTAIASPATSTNYTIVGNNGGCADTATITITVNPKATAGTISAMPDTVCDGSSATISVTGSTGNIQWQTSSDSISFSMIAGDSVATYTTAGLTQNTYYRIQAENACGSDTSSSIQIIVGQLPVPVLSANDTLICSGDSTHICASGGNTYTWNTGDSSSCIYVTNAQAYWVTATGTGGCRAISSHLNVKVYPASSVSIVVQGDTLSSFNSSSYQWLFNDSIITGATANVYVAHRSGEYAVQIIDSNGCKALSDNTPVIISGITEMDSNMGVNIYPNPFTNSIFITVTDPAKMEKVYIYNVLGEKIISKEMSNQFSNSLQVDVSTLQAGAYSLEITINGKVYTRKMVKAQ